MFIQVLTSRLSLGRSFGVLAKIFCRCLGDTTEGRLEGRGGFGPSVLLSPRSIPETQGVSHGPLHPYVNVSGLLDAVMCCKVYPGTDHCRSHLCPSRNRLCIFRCFGVRGLLVRLKSGQIFLTGHGWFLHVFLLLLLWCRFFSPNARSASAG